MQHSENGVSKEATKDKRDEKWCPLSVTQDLLNHSLFYVSRYDKYADMGFASHVGRWLNKVNCRDISNQNRKNTTFYEC